MIAFLLNDIELAVKRSKLTISDKDLLYSVNSILGDVRVNFDAEYTTNRFDFQQSKELCSTYYKWSETCQTSADDANTKFKEIVALLEISNRFSVNFVIGNKRYGCSEKFITLENALKNLEADHNSLLRENIKIGAERIINGFRSMQLCKRYKLTTYLLQNEDTQKLIELAKENKVKIAMYTIARISNNKSKALNELLEIVGNGYFNRRNVKDSEIKEKANNYCIYGSEKDIVNQARLWNESGVETLVLNLACKNYNDYLNQLHKLKSIIK